MAIIPEKIINNGYKSIGLLSAQYFNLKKDQFVAGFYEKNNSLYLIVSASQKYFSVFNISTEYVDHIMKDKVTLIGFLIKNVPAEIIPFKKTNRISHLALLFRLFILSKTNQLHDYHNKYYRWNSYLNLKQYNQD
jgi:hypothetical protein